MATGKNKKYKAGNVKKGNKRKIAEPFSKKEWYNVKVPKNFKRRNVGQIVVNKTTGTKVASDQLRGRVVEVNLADLMESEKFGAYNYKFRCEDVNGKDCLMVFHSLKLTTDKLRSIVKKWCTLIETSVDVKTTDGNTIRVFCIGFTTRKPSQIKKTSYAKKGQAKLIRKIMGAIITKQAINKDLPQFVDFLREPTLTQTIIQRAEKIFPIDNVYIRKVKILKSGKIDSLKLLEQHQDANEVVESIPAEEPVEEEIKEVAEEEDKQQ
ncbi:40S ribosomal protein S3A, putative [Entamoeba invadens IP1]|uniref:Small ribosomal subunit protein eS1 n=2 Tax=Entamoeba invadens TaxID=33085 RepID=A0A0A1TUD0_ENTIV|nr:40S ribosomal protein S3A, putative [Entamoeba invadens IP1]ELP83620.1 40S ribosomal protein S3A, putative [Entamoeba invadens IP1]BAN42453.1 40S ribosomal protein S3A, putative [Entamoeba invadens]BAN42573.1 40S ribosomal protein S3A, putative [Entamoeba invadens]|eukprot:XP_004182966.1 40S ribosomal protein S3A, putative [Entamoeba invadens IP1]